MHCPCCSEFIEDNVKNYCHSCRYEWSLESINDYFCCKTDKPSTYIVAKDSEGRSCVLATHYFIGSSFSHGLYWANAPLRLRNKTRQLIEASNMPVKDYEDLYQAVDELTLTSLKCQGSFPDYVVLKRNKQGETELARVVSRFF